MVLTGTQTLVQRWDVNQPILCAKQPTNATFEREMGPFKEQRDQTYILQLPFLLCSY